MSAGNVKRRACCCGGVTPPLSGCEALATCSSKLGSGATITLALSADLTPRTADAVEDATFGTRRAELSQTIPAGTYTLTQGATIIGPPGVVMFALETGYSVHEFWREGNPDVDEDYTVYLVVGIGHQTGDPGPFADPCGGMVIYAIAVASDGFYYLAYLGGDPDWVFTCDLASGPYTNEAAAGTFGSTVSEGVGVATGASASTAGPP